MERVIDVQSSGRPAVFDRADTDSLFGRTQLIEQPLSQHLLEREEPRFVAWNKQSGIRAIQGDSETLAPTGDYRAFLIATDVRVVFVIGDADGDRTISLPYEDIVTVEYTATFRKSTLDIVTVAEKRWQFDCRGDLAPVQSFVDETVQVWTHALTELDRAESLAADAKAAVVDDALSTAASKVDDAQEALDSALERVSELGPGAGSTVADRLEAAHRAIATCRRSRHVGAGDREHEAAREAWEEQEYERAADAYDRARTAYDRAQDVTADQPPADAIEARRDRVRAEYEQLMSAPITAAEAAVSAARDATDPAVQAQRWETALSRYRVAYELDWGRERRFDGDPAALREAAADTADELFKANCRAGQMRLDAADTEADASGAAGSKAALMDAKAYFERAREVATEIVPNRCDPPTDGLTAVAERLVQVEQ